MEQWAKTEIRQTVDPGVDVTEVFAELGPIRTLVQKARDGRSTRDAVRSGLRSLVQQGGGWVAIGVWRLVHKFGPAAWLGDREIRAWFVDGLRTVALRDGDERYSYQPAPDEEELLRQHAATRDPLWRFIPMRGGDLVSRPVPEPGDEPPWTELAVGEERRLAVMTSDADSNIMLAVHRDNGQYAAMIDAPRSSDNPERTRFDLLVAATLPDLYRRVGQNLSTRSAVAWAHDELEPYFPNARPSWRP